MFGLKNVLGRNFDRAWFSCVSGAWAFAVRTCIIFNMAIAPPLCRRARLFWGMSSPPMSRRWRKASCRRRDQA